MYEMKRYILMLKILKNLPYQKVYANNKGIRSEVLSSFDWSSSDWFENYFKMPHLNGIATKWIELNFFYILNQLCDLKHACGELSEDCICTWLEIIEDSGFKPQHPQATLDPWLPWKYKRMIISFLHDS